MFRRYFQYYNDSKEFILSSDHTLLVHKFHSLTLSASPCQQRYLDYIAKFTNKFEHVKGKYNITEAILRSSKLIGDLNNVLLTTKGLDYYLKLALAQRTFDFPMPTVWRFSAVLFLSYNSIKTGVKLFGNRSVWTAMRKDIANSPTHANNVFEPKCCNTTSHL